MSTKLHIFRRFTRELAAQQYVTPREKANWSPMQVSRLIKRIEEATAMIAGRWAKLFGGLERSGVFVALYGVGVVLGLVIILDAADCWLGYSCMRLWEWWHWSWPIGDGGYP